MYTLTLLISMIGITQDRLNKDVFNWFGSTPKTVQVKTQEIPRTKPKPIIIYQQPQPVYYYTYPITSQYCTIGGT